jgi:hypothetical protein
MKAEFNNEDKLMILFNADFARNETTYVRDLTEEEVQMVSDGIGTLQSWADSDGGLIKVDKEIEESKEKKKSEIAKARYETEIGGVDFNGITIPTDWDTQSKMTAAYIYAKDDVNFSVEWKISKDEFISLDSTDIIAIGDLIKTHVQDAFSKEKQLLDQINSSTTIDELKEIVW